MIDESIAMEIIEAEGYEIDVHVIDGEEHHFMTIPALVRLYDLMGKPVSDEWRKEVAFLTEGKAWVNDEEGADR